MGIRTRSVKERLVSRACCGRRGDYDDQITAVEVVGGELKPARYRRVALLTGMVQGRCVLFFLRSVSGWGDAGTKAFRISWPDSR